MDEDIQTILSVLPTWDESVWAPLQQKQFTTAEQNMENLFGDFSLEDWEAAYWEGIFSGIPMVAGDLSDDDWTKSVRPALVRAILNSGNGKTLSVVIQDLSPDSQRDFQTMFWQSIPGETANGKLDWLKTQRQSIYNFVIAAPAQDIGFNPRSLSAGGTDKYLKRYRFVPAELKRALYSYEGAETIYRTCVNHHLSDDKTGQVAEIVGQVILGFVHPDDFPKVLKEGLGIDPRICDEIGADIKAGLIGGLVDSISTIYEPTSELNGPPAEKVISLENIGGEEESIPVETLASVTLKEKKPETPFILHEEKVPEGNITSKTVFRSVTAPLGGFFLKKKRPAAGETKTPFAKLEIPGIKPEEKRVVHYSETRTPLASLEEPSFISVGEEKPLTEKNQEFEPPVGGSTSNVVIKPKTETPVPEKIFTAPKATAENTIRENQEVEPPTGGSTSIIGTIKKPEPKIEGNTIDLSNG